MAKKLNILNNMDSLFSGMSGLAASTIANSQIEDTSNEESLISDILNTRFSTGSLESLETLFNGNNLAKTDYTQKDLRGLSVGQMASNTLSGAFSGAMSGAKIGGVPGAIVGGVLGLGSGINGILTGNNKARMKAAELNAESLAANNMYLNNYNDAVASTQNKMYNNSLLNMTAYGGPINIKPSKRGTFTEAAKKRGLGVQEFASKVLANKENYSTAMIRKANFAKNASKWHHEDGGFLFNGDDFSNGLTFINTGGTHSQNPFGGIQIGIDNQGIPNMVEEGEVIYNDYVFSNRLKPSKKQLEENGFNKKYNNWTFAKIVEDIQKESENSPNDYISQNTLNDMLSTLTNMQEHIRMSRQVKDSNKFALGGPEGTYMSILNREAQEANNIINSFLDKEYNKEALPFNTNIFYTKDSITPEDIAGPSIRSIFNKDVIPSMPETQPINRITSNNAQQLSPVTEINIPKIPMGKSKASNFTGALRYLSPLAQAGTLINNLKQPDYSSVDRIVNAAYNIPGGNFTPIGDFIKLDSIDSNTIINPIIANSAANRRAIQNQSLNAGQANAALLSGNYATNTAIGESLIKGTQANNAIKSQEAQFNRGTRQINSQLGLQSLAMDQQRGINILEAIKSAEQLRSSLDAQRASAISQSLTGLTEDLSNISREKLDRNTLAKLIERGVFQEFKNE